MGYKLAGYEVIGANDIDPEMARNYKHNFSPKHYFLMPISELVTLARSRELSEEFYDLDVLDGSPPCSSFSTSGNREKNWGQEKRFREGQSVQVLDRLFFDYIDLVEALQPKVSIAENVSGMLKGNARWYVHEVLARYRAANYRVQLFKLNGSDCGVPQRRERVFFVALRNDYALDNGLEKLELAPRSRWRTVRQAFQNLPVLRFLDAETSDTYKMLSNTPTWNVGLPNKVSPRELWKMTGPGQRYADALEAAGCPPSRWDWRRLHWDKPSPTIPATDTKLHPAEPRYLTAAEVFRLSSFPDDYAASNPSIAKYLAGMSVPPFMTRTVALAVREQWLRH
jgi:DNA (cytosine-5)-methyltransferase 1